MEFILFDRIEKIKQIISKYGEENFYISFSGGKDSTVLHYLIDLALPDNRIPRVFINTGIEYKDIVEFVKSFNDRRFVIIAPTRNIKETLEEFGYPFKSKQHSHNLAVYQNSGMTATNIKYLDDKKGRYKCPNILKYQFSDKFNLKISDKCCYKLKKEPIAQWQKENNRSITITGMRKSEGGNRNNITCIVTGKENNVIKFHPLSVLENDFIEWFINEYDIKLCKLYYPPFNFSRTGCKGCPFSLDLQDQLTTMSIYLPNERKQCEKIWQPVYEEYRKLGYRLDKTEQLKLF